MHGTTAAFTCVGGTDKKAWKKQMLCERVMDGEMRDGRC